MSTLPKSLLLLVLFLTGCATQAQPSAKGAGPFHVVDLKGQHHDLDAALEHGESVALVFWQTWCESCEDEAPSVVAAARRYGSSIRFLGVVSGRDGDVDDSEVEQVARTWGYAFPQIRDRDLRLARRMGVRGTPTIVVLGADQAVRYRGHHPPQDWAALEGTPRSGASGGQECTDGVCPLPVGPE